MNQKITNYWHKPQSFYSFGADVLKIYSIDNFFIETEDLRNDFFFWEVILLPKPRIHIIGDLIPLNLNWCYEYLH